MRKYLIACIALVVVLMACPNINAVSKDFVYADPETSRTLIPIRKLSETFGYEVTWNQSLQSVLIRNEDTVIDLKVGSSDAFVNEVSYLLETRPIIQDGVTYVPLRFVSDALGLSMNWEQALNSIVFERAGQRIRLPIVTLGSERGDPIVRLTETYDIDGKSIRTEQIIVDLLNPKVSLEVAIAQNQVGSVSELSSISESSAAMAAINGTFFDAYTESEVKNPYGYIVKNGEVVWKAPGDKRTVFVFDSQDHAGMVSGSEFVKQLGVMSYEGALQVGPRLLTNGEITVDPAGEGFTSPKILKDAFGRSAIGVTKDHRLIMLTSSAATISQLAEALKLAGAHQAMNMDGGASSGLYYDGEYITRPGRLLSNALVVRLNSD